MNKLFLFWVGICFAAPALALSVPEKPQSYLNDYASLLSAEARGRIERTLAEYERETSNQVVVAIFQSLEGGSLEDFSIRLAEKWKPGQKDKDNGVILLIFKEDRAVRIEVGYGLEGALPDAVANEIIYNEIVPAFRSGNFDGGIESAVGAIIQATRGKYKAAGSAEDQMKAFSPLVFAAMVLYFLFPIVCYLFIVGAATAVLGFPLGLVVGLIAASVLALLRQFFMMPLVGRTLSGHRRGYGIWGGPGGWGGGGFGGGFSGGGGSFGGGGASGRW